MADTTVLMTTFREKKDVLRQSLESILRQTWSDFDFLIIADDPENDSLLEQLEEARKADGRIRILVNNQNLGLPGALNRGLDEITTKYVARMDADDIALPERLERQRDFMETHSSVSLCGTNIINIDEDGKILHRRGWIPQEPAQIARTLKYVNVLRHPTFFFRTDVIRKFGYRALIYAQDYDLTCRLAESGILMANLPDFLLLYRCQGVRPEKKLRQWITSDCIRRLVRQRCLCETDIVSEVNLAMENVDSVRLRQAISEYESSFDILREGKPLDAVWSMLRSVLHSPVTFRTATALTAFIALRAYYRTGEKLSWK